MQMNHLGFGNALRTHDKANSTKENGTIGVNHVDVIQPPMLQSLLIPSLVMILISPLTDHRIVVKINVMTTGTITLTGINNSSKTIPTIAIKILSHMDMQLSLKPIMNDTNKP
jgi:hypothetical protein